jgi:hypothetical protein
MYQYLNNLKIDLEDLKQQVSSIPEEQWQHWQNPRGKIVRNYKQVYLADTNLKLDSILEQISIDTKPVVFLRYNPFSRLHPHTDWVNKTAILIGISDQSNIIFWKGAEKHVVSYTAPILANLEKTHSVENNFSTYRYLLKIPFESSYENILEQISELV